MKYQKARIIIEKEISWNNKVHQVKGKTVWLLVGKPIERLVTTPGGTKEKCISYQTHIRRTFTNWVAPAEQVELMPEFTDKVKDQTYTQWLEEGI